MLEYQLKKLERSGFKNVVINTHHFGDMILDYLLQREKCSMNIRISEERDMLLDTGGGIRKALKLFDNHYPVLVHNVDVFSSLEADVFYRNHSESGNDVSMLVARRNTSRHLFFDENNALRGWSDSKTGCTRSVFNDFNQARYEPMAFQGIHIISDKVESFLDSVEEKSFSIMDFYLSFANRLSIKSVTADPSFEWVDAGRPHDIEKALRIIQLYYQ